MGRNYFIDKRFQLKYTLWVTGISSLIYAALGYQLYKSEVAKTKILEIQNVTVQNAIQGQDLEVLWYLGIIFVVQILSLFVLGILITHRIAGPMHRVHSYLEHLAETGEVEKFNPVRSHDEFRDFFDSLQAAMEKVGTRQAMRNAKLEELEKLLQKAQTDSTYLHDARKILEGLRSKS